MDGLSASAAQHPGARDSNSTPVIELDGKQSNSSTTTAPAAATEARKVSMMVKSGLKFVIPKNKLSGALVPVTRGAGKCEPLDVKKDESDHPSRKTRWGPDLTQDLSVKRGRVLALQTRSEQLAAQLESSNLDIDNDETTRPPSPTPVYESPGHKENIREEKKEDQSDIERREAIEECIKLDPSYKPPSGFKPVPKEAKLSIPTREHPGYNFIGLILDPHGNIQKRMEAETGAKISLKGKGAIKEGKLPVHNVKDVDEDLEDMHVHISADSYDKVDAAVAMIEPLLNPIYDQSMHRIKQLSELAEMNGIVQICAFCCEVGHREWQCPKDKFQTFQAKGKAIDLNFLEELGADLGDLAKISAGTSQPMLLTAAGAQPMPAKWMASDSDIGARFPFPIPARLQGSNTLNFLLPRFFQGLFRGGTFSPMMARMFSAFMERFPSPPGLNPDIRMPVPSEGLAPSQAEVSGQDQVQTSGSGGNQPAGSTSVEGENENAVVSSAATSFPSNTGSSSLTMPVSLVVPRNPFQGNQVPTAATSMQIISAPTINNQSPVIPPALPSSIIAPPVTVPMRPVIPSIRPAFRPVVSVPSQAGHGFWTGTSNALSGNNVQQSEPWTGATTWGPGQYSQQQSYLHLERATQPAVTVHQGSDGAFASRAWSSSPAPTRMPSVQSAIAPGHGPHNVNLSPVQPSSVRPVLPPNPIGQFVIPASEQLAPHPINHANPNLGYIQSGSQIRASNNVPPVHISVPSFSSVNHQMHVPQQSFPFQPREMPSVHRAQVPLLGVEFPSGLNNVRQDGSFPVPASRSYMPRSLPSDPVFNDQQRRPPLFPSQPVYNFDPLIPRHVLPSVPNLEQRMRMGGQVNANLLHPSRPLLPQAWRQSEANLKWTGSASTTKTPEVDPEYEKLMASVGVL